MTRPVTIVIKRTGYDPARGREVRDPTLPPSDQEIADLAAELRAEGTTRGADGQVLNIDGVDFEKIAKNMLTGEFHVEGWEAPRILPPLWCEVSHSRSPIDGTTMYTCPSRKLKAILSCSLYDGRPWLHLSVSHKARMPTWSELAEAKRVFLGDREAYQVMPPKERYVNINERVLHVWALFDEKQTALPDFTQGTGSL